MTVARGRDDDCPGHELHVLGFDFRRAPVHRRDGVLMCGFVPLVGKAARKSMARTIRQRNRGRRTNLGFRGPATVVDPVVPGWINYDGRFYKSELMNFLEQQINPFLVKWMVRKGQAAARQAESASQARRGCLAGCVPVTVNSDRDSRSADRPIVNTFEYPPREPSAYYSYLSREAPARHTR